jgi:hypothetical protein
MVKAFITNEDYISTDKVNIWIFNTGKW